MNKRQAKKKFKKTYGVNPEKVYCLIEESIVDYINRSVEVIPSIIQQFIETLPVAIKHLSESVNEAVKCFYQNVRSMSDEDFEKICIGLTENEIVFLKNIRMKEVCNNDQENKNDQ